jgi:hypothetical protein
MKYEVFFGFLVILSILSVVIITVYLSCIILLVVAVQVFSFVNFVLIDV